MSQIRIYLLVILWSLSTVISAQNRGISFVEISTWTLVQAVPSPSFYEDANADNSRLQFGLKWNITPLNYSFNANRLVSPFQFFKVNPMRRYGGSIELFVQPEWMTSDSRYSGLGRFSLSPGLKAYIPLVEYGEYLSASFGVKYSIRKNSDDDFQNYPGIELGMYTFFGIAGFNFTYNFEEATRYNFSISLRYY